MDDEAYQIMLEEAEKEKKKREIEQEKSDRKLHEIVSSGWNSQGTWEMGGDCSNHVIYILCECIILIKGHHHNTKV